MKKTYLPIVLCVVCIGSLSGAQSSIKNTVTYPPITPDPVGSYFQGKNTTIPSSVDNSKKPYLRPVFDQLGQSCSEAAGVGITFTYEINALRKLPASVPENQYPYCHTYHFLNEGQDSVGTSDPRNGWQIIRENGIPSVTDYGGFINGYPTRWISGYDVYYKAMQNRLLEYFDFKANTPQGLLRLKKWLYDHGDGSQSGGVLNFGANMFEVYTVELPQGTPEAGKSIVLQWGLFTAHCLTIVGYNDSIRFDVNDDGKYTNDLDITGDGNIDMRDWEIGAVYFVNTWGTSWGDRGFAYMLYRSLALSQEDSGILNDNTVYGIKVCKKYAPKLACKIALTHNRRSQIRIVPGVSSDVQADTPSLQKLYDRQFNFAGGEWPMQGSGADSAVEIGLDVSDLLDSLNRNQARFFLQIYSKGGLGQIDSFSLMDYRGNTVKEIKCPQKNIPIKPGCTTTVSVVWNDSIPINNTSGIAHKNYAQLMVKVFRGKALIQLLAVVNNSLYPVTIFNASGKMVRRLELHKAAEGIFSTVWNCGDNAGNTIGSGLYFVEAGINGSILSRSIMIIR